MYSAVPVGAEDESAGYSYAASFVRANRADVLKHLAGLGFSGWIGPQDAQWVGIVPSRIRGAVTAKGAYLESFAANLARRLDALAFAAVVHDDRLLRLAMWSGSDELGSYVSDPTYGLPPDDEVFPYPQGVECADAFAEACGRTEQAEDLAELLGDVLDEESQNESERLAATLALLDLPRWLVAVGSLPHDLPGGPPAAQFTRLFRGRTGTPGRIRAWLLDLVRWPRAR